MTSVPLHPSPTGICVAIRPGNIASPWLSWRKHCVVRPKVKIVAAGREGQHGQSSRAYRMDHMDPSMDPTPSLRTPTGTWDSSARAGTLQKVFKQGSESVWCTFRGDGSRYCEQTGL